MTHLKIELNNGITEQVSPSVIEKLYEIVHSGNLDSSSNLMGSLNTTSTYLDYVNYLEELFTKNGVRLLVITANKLYISFNDPAVESYWANSAYGDGTGITTASAAAIILISNSPFLNNTSIVNLNGMLYFINCTNIDGKFAENATNLTSFTSPSNLIYLSVPLSLPSGYHGTFMGCFSLSNVILNEGLYEIGCRAFYQCTSLLTIDIPSTVEILSTDGTDGGWGAFLFCSNLTTVTGGEGVTKIGNDTFNSCLNLQYINDIDLSKLTYLGRGAFFDCLKLELGSVSIPNITSIDANIFVNCKKLTSINIPNVTIINPDDSGSGPFENCSALTTVTGSNIRNVGYMSFRNCTSLSTIDLSHVTYIGICAFQFCSSLTTIDLSSCASLQESAFNSCTGLTTVSIPSNLTTLNTGVFYGCSSLSSIDLSNVTIISKSCFKNCTSLTSIDLSSITLIGPLGPNNDNYNEGAFLGCTSLTTVIGLSDIDYIGGWSFTNCTSLGTNQDLVINTTQTFIGSAAFYKTKYRSVVVNGPNVTNLSNGYYKPFENMPNCTYFDISNTLVTSGIGVIPNTTNLETVILPSTFSSLTYATWSFDTNNAAIRYFIILSTTPPSYQDATYCKLGTNGNFYVPDSAVNDYKSAWPQTGYLSWDIHAHIKPLSELPNGVWTTGLASSYLTPALLVTS